MRYLILVALVGCGPAASSFAGSYSGTLDSMLVCDDGSNGSHTANARWTLSAPNEAGVIAVSTGANTLFGCSLLNATEKSDVATVTAIYCPESVTSTLRVQDFVKSGGTLTLDGDNLKIDLGLGSNLTYPSGQKAQCTGPLKGTIIRVD